MPIRQAPAISRRVVTAICGLMLLFNGTVFITRKNISLASYDPNIHCWETQSGSTIVRKLCIDKNGRLSGTGSFVYKGTMSGSSTLTLSPLGGAALGHALCPKAGGTVGYCSSVVGVDGTCTCN